MTPTLYILVTLYLCIGSAFGGAYLQEYWERKDWYKDIFRAIVLVLFGTFLLVLSLIEETFRFLWKQFRHTFELGLSSFSPRSGQT
jgi:hypothetical protein